MVIFAAGIGVGVGVSTGMGNADAEKDLMIAVIAGMPDPRNTSETLTWLDENGISYSREALEPIHKDIIQFAESEKLTAHANSIRVRFEK